MDHKNLLEETIQMAVNEAVSDKRMISALSSAFTTKIGMEDVKYIKFTLNPTRVVLEDIDGMLGNMHTELEPSDLFHLGMSAADAATWLLAHGARKRKRVVRARSFPTYD